MTAPLEEKGRADFVAGRKDEALFASDYVGVVEAENTKLRARGAKATEHP